MAFTVCCSDDSAGLTPLPAVVDSMTADEMDEVWPKIVGEVRDIVLGNVEPSDDQIPINSLLDVQDEQHQSVCTYFSPAAGLNRSMVLVVRFQEVRHAEDSAILARTTACRRNGHVSGEQSYMAN